MQVFFPKITAVVFARRILAAEFSFQGRVRLKNRRNENDTLHCRKNASDDAERCFIRPIEGSVDEKRRRKQDAPQFPPKSAAMLLRKFPCIRIFHGARRLKGGIG